MRMVTNSGTLAGGAAMRLSSVVAFGLLMVALGGSLVFGQSSPLLPGINAGEKIPPISAQDQFGRLQKFESLRGKHGLLLLFSRSADWCPYCKRQLLQLQQAKAEFAAKGVNVASITYDSVSILKLR